MRRQAPWVEFLTAVGEPLSVVVALTALMFLLMTLLSLAGCSEAPIQTQAPPRVRRPERPRMYRITMTPIFAGPGSDTVTAVIVENPWALQANWERSAAYIRAMESSPVWAKEGE